MELIDYGYIDEELEWFDIPSKPGAKLGGPPDLTGKQEKQIIAIVEGLGDETVNTVFFETILKFWIGLPGARWNLAHREDGKLVPMTLTWENISDELRRTDRAAIALAVSKLVFPLMFAVSDAPIETEEDVAEDLVMEAGSQAEEETEKAKLEVVPAPNAPAPRRKRASA